MVSCILFIFVIKDNSPERQELPTPPYPWTSIRAKIPESMVEKPYTLLHESNPQFLRPLEYGSIVLAPGGGCNISCTRASSAKDIIDEGELLFKSRLCQRSP